MKTNEEVEPNEKPGEEPALTKVEATRRESQGKIFRKKGIEVTK